MTGSEQELASLRRARDDTRGALADRLTSIQDALADASPAARVANDLQAQARAAADETLAVARGSGWVIAATLALLAAWIFRGPLGAAALRIREAVAIGEPPEWWARFRSWADRKAKL